MNLKEKRTLITGPDGFIGSHLTETLLHMGCDVRALSLYNSFNDWGWLEVIKGREKLDVMCGDVRSPHFCKSPNKNPMTHNLSPITYFSHPPSTFQTYPIGSIFRVGISCRHMFLVGKLRLLWLFGTLLFFVKRIGITLFRRYFLQTTEGGVHRGLFAKGDVLKLRHARGDGFFCAQ